MAEAHLTSVAMAGLLLGRSRSRWKIFRLLIDWTEGWFRRLGRGRARAARPQHVPAGVRRPEGQVAIGTRGRGLPARRHGGGWGCGRRRRRGRGAALPRHRGGWGHGGTHRRRWGRGETAWPQGCRAPREVPKGAACLPVGLVFVALVTRHRSSLEGWERGVDFGDGTFWNKMNGGGRWINIRGEGKEIAASLYPFIGNGPIDPISTWLCHWEVAPGPTCRHLVLHPDVPLTNGVLFSYSSIIDVLVCFLFDS